MSAAYQSKAVGLYLFGVELAGTDADKSSEGVDTAAEVAVDLVVVVQEPDVETDSDFAVGALSCLEHTEFDLELKAADLDIAVDLDPQVFDLELTDLDLDLSVLPFDDLAYLNFDSVQVPGTDCLQHFAEHKYLDSEVVAVGTVDLVVMYSDLELGVSLKLFYSVVAGTASSHSVAEQS